MLQRIVHEVEAGIYQPNLDRVFAMDDIVAARRYMENDQAAGKIVIRPSNSNAGQDKASCCVSLLTAMRCGKLNDEWVPEGVDNESLQQADARICTSHGQTAAGRASIVMALVARWQESGTTSSPGSGRLPSSPPARPGSPDDGQASSRGRNDTTSCKRPTPAP